MDKDFPLSPQVSPSLPRFFAFSIFGIFCGLLDNLAAELRTEVWMDLLRKWFTIPRPENRRVLFEFAINNASAKRCDDVYVYYLIFRTSLIITLTLSLLNVISLVADIAFNLHFFIIDLKNANFVETFLFSFPKYASTVLLFFCNSILRFIF